MWGKIFNSIIDAFDFNQATLSGCIDIICVPQDDEGTLKSTPFHVRFGKAKLLRSREKVVNITVNGEEVDIRMKLGAEGEAYFVQETEEEIDDKNWETSPLSSPTSSPKSPTEFTEIAPLLTLDDNSTPTSSERILDSHNLSNLNSLKTYEPDEWLSWEWGNLPKKLVEDEIDLNSNDESFINLDPFEKLGTYFLSESFGFLTDEDSAIDLSLCAHLLKDTMPDQEQTEDIFNSHILSRDAFERNPLLWFDSKLIVRFKKRPPYLPWKIAYPLIFSLYAFEQPPSLEARIKLLNTSLKLHKPKYHPQAKTEECFSSNELPCKNPILPSNGTSKPDEQQSPPIQNNIPNLMTSLPLENFQESISPILSRKRFRKSLRPSSFQLNALKLKPGSNNITFSVTSSLQGTKTLSSTIYFWPKNPKIVISDVDGTITRSDVLGHLMPIVGKDWSHDGVADFFTKIRQNGYFILYLTSRAIGLADSTRDYLFSLTQNEQAKLPDGPLILSPDRFFHSLKREVIDRTPYLFKIAALRDIRDLFDSHLSPFYAGFGNREADHRAYVHAGIPESKVFIIDRRGVIHQVNSTYSKTYETLSELAEQMFPPLKDFQSSYDDNNEDKYNHFNFWKQLDYEIENLDSII